MTTTKKQPSVTASRKFGVGAEIKVWVEREITATSFEEALAYAQTLSSYDFVKAQGEILDSELRLVSVTDDTAISF